MEDDATQSANTRGSGQSVNVYVPRENVWRQPAIYVAILAFLVAFWAEREARMAEYYGVDLEVALAKHGYPVPPDPWGRLKDGDKR